MRRNVLNLIVDAITLLAIFAMVATGLVIRFVLPPGTGGRHGGHGLALWGMGRHDWGDIHFWAAVALAVLLVIHVALHWTWVCMTIRAVFASKDSTPISTTARNAYGFGFLLAVVGIFGGFTWYAFSVVQEVSFLHQVPSHFEPTETDIHGPQQRQGHGTNHDFIRGSMTLAEAEEVTGISVATLKAELGLPSDTPTDERLGRLGRQYGFSMDRVRDIVAKHAPSTNKKD